MGTVRNEADELHQRRMKVADESKEIAFEEVSIIETDETSWIRVGDAFVDVARIQAVGPNDDSHVQVLLEDGSFVTSRTTEVTLEDMMSLIVEATTGEDD